MQNIFALLSGLLFGLGLILSGMSNPAKVKGFLDIAGPWDPSLMLVMAGAVTVAAIAFAYARRRGTSLMNEALHLPQAKALDRRLLAGSATFGIGWGLAGICPGPALVLAGTGQALWFVGAMLAGMLLFELLQPRRT